MARARVARASTSASKGSALTPAQSRSINRAFDLAASPSSTTIAQTSSSSRNKKRSRTTIESSTENEGEDEYDMAIGPSGTSNSRNDATTENGWQGGGGGFLPEGEEADQVNGATATTGGGFIVEDDDRAASTISPYYGGGGGGGFIAEDSEMVDAGGGGFLPEPEDVPPLGGGFVPEDDDEGISELPDLPDLPSLSNSNDTTLPPPKYSTNLIPLRSIPVAIASLNLPASEKDLVDLFSDVAVPNEEGVECVAKERFVEVCKAFMAGMDDEDEDKSPASDDEDDYEGDAYEDRDESVKPSRRRSNRRSTRANYVQDDEPLAPLPEDFAPEDDDDDDDEESDFEDLNGSASKGKVTASAKQSKGKGKARTTKAEKRDPNRELSKQKVEEALDTFELFFEGSVDKRPLKDRAIAMHDLERVARLLNEDLPEDDVSAPACRDGGSYSLTLGSVRCLQIREMWDYAASTRGVVDLEAFARVLAQAL
ncbi:BZ3500_MvSof-1268-A1-R1_Chr4-2g07062 [Microbotryum saponariae]|uniref:BZ3500_MvSof-1268-A1-R1_Chr4-2g07062 protein n=1 Tax=Microbotryum saponariae TaxID=289078 RepID=A0A2X0MS68_9BASI|nr:BZ3500_MvSof-1268-A1-R1_Chr4-2g07062 [Microbotryum saponariae]SDA06727.1 BZ3501_MvSof-1269-A2-R1_Chr4-2g06773 [Microbotryum saponariae]